MDRRALGGGAGLVRRRPLPDLVGHSEQPHDAADRSRRSGLRLSRALQQFQRQHRRQPGPARHLRAPDAARHAAPNIDGSITVLADKWQGKRFNSPNDAVVKSDNSIWFTDPAYGIDTDYEGDRQKQEIDGCHVYRIDPKSGAVDRVISDMVRPNGIAFSPDEKYLYVADTGATHVENGPRHIRRFTVGANGKSVKGGEVFAEFDRRAVRRFPRRLEGPHLDERRGRRALLRSRRHADRQDPDPRDGRRTSRSAASSATGCSSAGRHRSTPSISPPTGRSSAEARVAGRIPATRPCRQALPAPRRKSRERHG